MEIMNLTDGLQILLVISVGIQGVIEVLKKMLPEKWFEELPGGIYLANIISLALGLTLTLVQQVDLFYIVSNGQINFGWIGYVLTGLILSTGSSFVNDLWNKIKGTSAPE